MTETWLELGYAVTGVDFAQTAVDAAAAHYGDRARFLLAGLDAVPPGAPYNLVVCIDVLFHVVRDHAWLAALRAMRDAADPAGPVIIQESLDPTQRASRHVRWRSRAEYAAALADLGMRIDEHQVYHLDGEDADKHVLVCRRNDIPTN
jgi:2-polyprenyl-3-methyl-5-hydroxy-6-metoxy-1,4-benzoquinol methylase